MKSSNSIFQSLLKNDFNKIHHHKIMNRKKQSVHHDALTPYSKKQGMNGFMLL